MSDEAAESIDEQPTDKAATGPEDAADKLDAHSSVERERDEARDQAMRAQAELENYRRRAQRDLADQMRYANMALMRDLLPVVDNIRRAIEAAQQSSDADSLLAGFKMVGQQLESVLSQHHLHEIEAEEAPFDPNLHEAISQQPSKDYPHHTVMHVHQRGYTLHDRVVRPAQVVISSQSAASGDDDAAEDEASEA